MIGKILELDERSLPVSSARATGGTCTAIFEPVPSDRWWLVDRLVVSCTSTTPTTAYVYDDIPGPNALLGGTSSGNFDFDDTNNPYWIEASRQLRVVWVGASAGSIGTVRAHYRVLTAA